MATIEARERTYGVGRIGPAFVVAAVALLALVVLGTVSYSHQYIQGEVVTGLRDFGTIGGAAWGLYIAFVV